MPAAPAMPMTDQESAAYTFSMSRLEIRLPMVARRSPPIRTPPSYVAATMVVACGGRSPTGRAGSARRPGSRSGAVEPRKSVNDEPTRSRYAGGNPLRPADDSFTHPPLSPQEVRGLDCTDPSAGAPADVGWTLPAGPGPGRSPRLPRHRPGQPTCEADLD